MSVNALASFNIANTFRSIATRTALTADDHDVFDRRRSAIVSSLKKAFEISTVKVMGSVPRGSAITGSSDLDLLVVLRREDVFWGDKPKTSTTVMSNVRATLSRTYTNSSIGRDGQAVVIGFSDGRDVDVVPAWFAGTLPSNWPSYAIPDGSDWWMTSSPDTHNKYIAGGDDASGGKLKSVVRIMKHWRESRADLALSAFHLELLLTEQGTCNGARSLAACVADTLALLASRGCRGLHDPCKVSGIIQLASTEPKRVRLLQAISTSSSYANKAIEFEAAGDGSRARGYWDLVFNGTFK